MPRLALDIEQLRDFHDRALHEPHPLDSPPPPMEAGLWAWIARNHHCNTLLWDEEDQARRRDVADAEIVRCKRAIDRHNQARNDAVEQIDLCLMDQLDGPAPESRARLHSETPGAMVDRLSILALKLHHMGRQLQRDDVDDAHLATCAAKLQRLQEQRADLLAALGALLDELAGGTARFKLYRQFKMYNDPTLNPWLARAARGAQPVEP
jgi:hypothetical protein